jgi:hypothetical protein
MVTAFDRPCLILACLSLDNLSNINADIDSLPIHLSGGLRQRAGTFLLAAAAGSRRIRKITAIPDDKKIIVRCDWPSRDLSFCAESIRTGKSKLDEFVFWLY